MPGRRRSATDSDAVSAPDAASTASTADASPAGRSAIRDVCSHLRFWPVALIGLAVDLWTKQLAFARLDPNDAHVLIPHLITLRRSINPGALFGIGQGLAPVFIIASFLALGFALYMFWHSSPRQRSLHIALGLILAGAFGNLYDRTTHTADAVWERTNGWSLRGLAGKRIRVTGKLLSESEHGWVFGAYPDGDGDRFTIPRTEDRSLGKTPVVRDFIKIEPRIGSFELWPWVFNLAHSFLVIGVILLFLNLWFGRAPRTPQAETS
jgi:lipoprotein signal peptidase